MQRCWSDQVAACVSLRSSASPGFTTNVSIESQVALQPDLCPRSDRLADMWCLARPAAKLEYNNMQNSDDPVSRFDLPGLFGSAYVRRLAVMPWVYAAPTLLHSTKGASNRWTYRTVSVEGSAYPAPTTPTEAPRDPGALYMT